MKDLIKRTISDLILKDRAYEIARNRGYDGNQGHQPVWYISFLIRKKGPRASLSEQLAEEIPKPLTKKFKRRNVYATYKDRIWTADLAEMKSLSSKNKNVKYLLCVINVFTKYAWIEPLKDKKGKKVLNTFIEIVNESNSKPNKLWVDQEREFYNKLMQVWLNNNDILMDFTYNKGKSIITERFIERLKSKIYKK